MSRIIVADKGQLKCNFCTQWFTTSLYFSIMQKHSINICQKCMKDFNYQLIDSETYEVYDIFLINSGVKVKSKSIDLAKNYSEALEKLKTMTKDQCQTEDKLVKSI